MTTQVTSQQESKQPLAAATAGYFGLEVQVVLRLQHCSLIHYQNSELVVDTADLQEGVSTRPRVTRRAA